MQVMLDGGYISHIAHHDNIHIILLLQSLDTHRHVPLPGFHVWGIKRCKLLNKMFALTSC